MAASVEGEGVSIENVNNEGAADNLSNATELKTRVRDIKQKLRHSQTKRHERKVQQRDCEEGRRVFDSDKTSTKLARLETRCKGQTEDINSVYETLTGLAELQKEEMTVLLRDVDLNSRASPYQNELGKTDLNEEIVFRVEQCSQKEETDTSTVRQYPKGSHVGEHRHDSDRRNGATGTAESTLSSAQNIDKETEEMFISKNDKIRRKVPKTKEKTVVVTQVKKRNLEDHNCQRNTKEFRRNYTEVEGDNRRSIFLQRLGDSELKTKPKTVTMLSNINLFKSNIPVTEASEIGSVTTKPTIEATWNQHRSEAPVFGMTTDMWIALANEEANKAKSLRAKSKPTGKCTVLCLDISGSMEGAPWAEMRNFVMQYLDEIERTSMKHSLHENVALVTFGHETQIVHHLTTDYKQLKSTIDKLHPNGPSPMFAGILLAGAAATNGVFDESNHAYMPRVVLVTDGRPTQLEFTSGSDRFAGELLPKALRKCAARLASNRGHLTYEVESPVINQAKKLGYRGYKLFIVPVGNFTTTGFLTRMAYVTYGDVLLADDDRTQFCRSFRNHVTGIRIQRDHDAFFNRFALDLAARRMDPEFNSKDTDEMESYLRESAQRNIEKDDDRHMDSDIGTLPQVGSRVGRGPDWFRFLDEDGGGPGTVVGMRPPDRVNVAWDVGRRGYYKYGGLEGAFEVILVDEFRDPRLGIGTGCLVKRGPDWSWGDEDGGRNSIGVIYRVRMFEIVYVRWPNGTHKVYKMGYDGEEDVQLCDTVDIERYKKQRKDESQKPRQQPTATVEGGAQKMKGLSNQADSVTMDDLLAPTLYEPRMDPLSLLLGIIGQGSSRLALPKETEQDKRDTDTCKPCVKRKSLEQFKRERAHRRQMKARKEKQHAGLYVEDKRHEAERRKRQILEQQFRNRTETLRIDKLLNEFETDGDAFIIPYSQSQYPTSRDVARRSSDTPIDTEKSFQLALLSKHKWKSETMLDMDGQDTWRYIADRKEANRFKSSSDTDSSTLCSLENVSPAESDVESVMSGWSQGTYTGDISEAESIMNETNSSHVPLHYVWQYQSGSRWKDYPEDVGSKIEQTFKKSPRSTVLITLNGEMYRVVLSKLQHIHLQSRKKVDVQRIGLRQMPVKGSNR